MNEIMNEKLYGYQDGIVETVRLVLESAADGHEAITPNIAGALGMKLRTASGWYSPMDSKRTSLADVARILLAAAQEKLNLSPVLAGVFASLLATASGAEQSAADTCGREGKLATSGEDKPAAAMSAPARTRKAKPADGTAEIAGYFTPEEAGKLIEDIRGWLSECRTGHGLGDLMSSIEYCFKLSDGQLGEILGVSSRLVCHVRHGRPSPFAKARFAELFGVDGGAK